jgi:translin
MYVRINESSLVSDVFEEIFERIKQKLDADDEIREATLKATRNSIRLCQEAVRSIHRKEFEIARGKLEEASNLILELENNIKNKNPELYYKGSVLMMHQEFVEASLLLILIEDKTKIPSPEALNVSHYAYLSGLGDVIGELRRHSLDAIRDENFLEAERSLNTMEEIFNLLRTLDYPEGLIPGIRRKVDVARSLIEKTRSDLTYFKHGKTLVNKMNQLLESLKKSDSGKE